MTELCHRIMTMVSSNITWLSSNNAPTNDAYPVDPYLNIYNEINYPSILGIGLDKHGDSNLISQFIDPNGKARAFTAEYDGHRISYVTIPTAPENAPSDEKLATPPIEIVDNVLYQSHPTARSIDNEGLTNGIWFKLFNLDEGIYVPIEATDDLPDKYAELPIGSINPLMVPGKNSQTEQYRTTAKVARFIKEIIQWLYEVYRSDTINVDLEDFCHQALAIRIKAHHDINRNYISLFKIPRRLPIMTGDDNITALHEALAYLSNYTDVVKNGKFQLHDKSFYDSIKAYLTKYDELMHGSQPVIFDSIDMYYEYESDFTKYPGTLTFIGNDSISQWLSNIAMAKEKIYTIRNKLDLGISGILDPRVYVDPHDFLWMVQNSYGGTLEGALAIAKSWKLNRINPGPHIDKLDEIPAHYIYVIGASGDIVAIADNTGGSPDYLNIIKYSEHRYGALLPLI